MLAAYEQLLTEKNGRTTIASRTRQKLSRKGVELCLIEWTEKNSETMGFSMLVDAGMRPVLCRFLGRRVAVL
jgi:hypothetical protein